MAVLSLSVPSAVLVVLLTRLYEVWRNHPLLLTVVQGLLALRYSITPLRILALAALVGLLWQNKEK